MNTITEKQNKLLAFSLFTAAMRMGPSSFKDIEMIAVATDVMAEFEGYAKSWLSYSTKPVQEFTDKFKPMDELSEEEYAQKFKYRK